MLESRTDLPTCRTTPSKFLPEAAGSEPKHARYNVRSRYEFVRTLGKGTYGKVKLAVQKDTGKQFAVKTIRKDRITDKKDMQHIRREMKIMSSLHHPNIIQIHEVFENQDKIVIVMEYASKGELYDYLADKKITSEEESRVYFRQIVSAVQYCHKLGVVHRDLKLENILLGDNFEIKIADFGLANLFKSDQQLHTFCGSPLYASPEIVNGVPYTGPEVDSWSLGVLLYALVYGTMPFDGSDYKTLTRQISNGEYSRRTKHTDAGDLISKMLTVDPTERADIDQISNHFWLQNHHVDDILDANSNYVSQPKNIYSPATAIQHQQQQHISALSPVPSGFMNHSTSPIPPILNGYVAPATSPNPTANGYVVQTNGSTHPHVGKLASEKLSRTVLTPCSLENCENSNCPLTQRKGILKRFGAPMAAHSVQANVTTLPPSWPQHASSVQHNTLNGAMFVKDASCGLHAKDSLKLKAKPPGASGKRRNLRSKKDRESGYYSSPERTPVEANPSQPTAPVFTFASPIIKPQLATNINPANLKPRHVQPPSDILLQNQFAVPFPYVVPMPNLNQTMPILEGQAMSYFPTNQVTVASSVEQSPVVPYTVTTLNSEETQARGQRPISTYSDSSILSSDSFELCTFESPLPSAVIFSTVGLTPTNTVIRGAQPTTHPVALSHAVRPPLSLPVSSPLHYADGRSSPVPSGALTPTSAKLNQDLTRILAPNEPRIRRKEDAKLREPLAARLTEEQETQLGEMMRQLSIDLERACPKGMDNMKVSLTASAEV